MVISLVAPSAEAARQIVRRLQPGARIISLEALVAPPSPDALRRFWTDVKRLNSTVTGHVRPGPTALTKR